MELKDILNLKIDNSDFDSDLTIKGYLMQLLIAVWEQGESFSGKRPFGNSGWEYDVYKPLLVAGLVAGELNEDGDIYDIDTLAGDKIIYDLIKFCFDHS